MDVEILQEDGIGSGRDVTLDPTVFEIEPNDHVIWLDVKRIQANSRQGTAKTKQRSEVRGSGRKLYRQKGTGNARVGDAQSPIRRGGGRAHGADVRDFSQKVNKKARRLARRSALSYKVQNDALYVVEPFDIETPSTRQLVEALDLLEIDEDAKVLIVTEEVENAVMRSASNVSRLSVREVHSLNTIDVLDADAVVLYEGAVDWLNDTLSVAETADA
jgi:large subunit ribosomal protein L4